MDVDWTPQLAEEAAGVEGIALGEKHWCAIAGARELIARNDCAPSLAEIGAACGVTVAQLKALFPGGAEDILARLAGAPEFERNVR